MTTLTTIVRNRRIDVPAPVEIPDGAEVTLTIAERNENSPLPPEEIARVLFAMQSLPTWDIPDDVANDLDSWEKQLNQRGIEHRDSSMESVFP